MTYTLAVHVPIIALAVLPVLFGWPLVLAPLHIAFLELVIDPACSLVFEAEGSDPDLMHQPPILPSRTARTDWRSLGAGLTTVSRWVLVCTLLALLAVTVIPWLARNFGFLPLTPLQWLAALAAGLAMVPLLHLSKILLVSRAGPV
jgi:Ca2+-transporting ATPase